ncbi:MULTISPECIES: YHS domain-containing (seleno)protein [unclassified Oceanispirochaeta]|uniref:YHS domain-containing (seleno)protein n=1 Tax=unclassified Oceanispirochaeta TaxID=2635722 RepID=UPI000E096353|nr:MULTISPECIES: YHS domain-containing (seleno)protein [unclassified Oceanispirochaeta]MBF9016346.1 YHS domain-containing protein [Oceanispirochaeta sp. M2]NPD72808.1 YHS domain-containing protein [Oceanispirochaeta sp. M1]RDG31652.1 YHS domain-containing protein [Oceanispirochaeta sp. M1]
MRINIMLFSLFFLPSVLMAGEINTDRKNIAIDGYDALAYHLQNKAVKGVSKFSIEWKGAVWYFSSSEYKELFKENPEEYAPLYGGHCANGLSDRHKVYGNPEIWLLQEGELFFFYSRRGRRAWIAETDTKRQQADEYWRLVQFD